MTKMSLHFYVLKNKNSSIIFVKTIAISSKTDIIEIEKRTNVRKGRGVNQQEVKEMRTVSKPIKMLAEFTPDNGASRPRKFKWNDGRGFEETVIVDEVVAIDDKAFQFVIYDCISYYENSSRSYQLIYWHGKHLWELYKI